ASHSPRTRRRAVSLHDALPISTVLAPLGFALTAATPDLIEFGALSIGTKEPPTPPIHFAFLARSREAVDEFHRAGVEAGYRSNRSEEHTSELQSRVELVCRLLL